MQLSPEGLRFIQQFEGLALAPYRCPAGYLTVGYGHVLTPTECQTLPQITADTARSFLAQDVRIAEQSVARLITSPLRQHQFDALVSFTFNLGSGALQRSTLRRLINRGDHQNAPHEFTRWVWAGGKKLPGLVKRRQAEAELYGQH